MRAWKTGVVLIGLMTLLSACATTKDLSPLPTQSIDAPPPPPPPAKTSKDQGPLPTQPIDAPPPPPPGK